MADSDSGRLAKGTVLASRYALDGLLGHGGMADVYHGTDQVLGRQVAVKVLGPQFARDQSFVARFRREAQAAAALNHPNLVSVFDTGSDDGTHYIVMEYVAGTTLAKLIRDEGRLPPDRAATIALAVARALAFAHRARLVHRDVKPANIMLSSDGAVKVMDFGIARTTNGESLTQTAAVLGTATYFSPEQAQGEAVDARSDIYALGCVLFEMLTGHPPFSGENPVAVAYKHVQEDPPHPSDEAHGVPPELEAIVMRCLAKDPEDRYQTAEDLADDLQRFRTGPATEPPHQPRGGTVLAYNPKPAVPGDTIPLTVSSGPAQVSVPNVVCETRRDAIDALKAVGLTAVFGQPPMNNAICPTKGV